jgi:hypothetical protein
MTALRICALAVSYAFLIAAAVVWGTSAAPFVYQGF